MKVFFRFFKEQKLFFFYKFPAFLCENYLKFQKFLDGVDMNLVSHFKKDGNNLLLHVTDNIFSK